MSDIPLFIFEEHHEAFFVWHYAIANKMMAATKNTLLHVDEHSDLKIPRFNFPLKSIGNSLENIHRFTYTQLSIADFIIPAVYQGLFSQLYWIYQSRHVDYPASMYVYSHDRQGKLLATKSSKALKTADLFDSDYHSTKYQALKSDEDLPQVQSVILDIDLDYFSCNNRHHNFKGKLEISAVQYYEFIEDPYHFLRITLGSEVKAVKQAQRYFLHFNDFPGNEWMPNPLKVSEAEIINRIEAFALFLERQQIKPQIIDVCRSRISGFTPENQWRFIEENLIQRLAKIYSLNSINLGKFQTQVA